MGDEHNICTGHPRRAACLCGTPWPGQHSAVRLGWVDSREHECREHPIACSRAQTLHCSRQGELRTT